MSLFDLDLLYRTVKPDETLQRHRSLNPSLFCFLGIGGSNNFDEFLADRRAANPYSTVGFFLPENAWTNKKPPNHWDSEASSHNQIRHHTITLVPVPPRRVLDVKSGSRKLTPLFGCGNRCRGAKGYTTIRLAALKDGLYSREGKKKQVPRANGALGMTLFEFGSMDKR